MKGTRFVELVLSHRVTPRMPQQWQIDAINLALNEYQALYSYGGALAEAAFGVAAAHLQERLNITLSGAAEILWRRVAREPLIPKKH